MNASGAPTEHTLKAFDLDLTELRGLVAELSGRAEKAIERAIQALANFDVALAEQVVAEDKQIDALERAVDKMVIQTIALRAPMADDLRELVAVLKIANVIERVGDYAKNIARRVALIDPDHRIESAALIPAMGSAALELVDDALTAFARRDPELALEVCARDKVVDDFYNSIFRSLITQMIDNPEYINAGAHLLFVAKNLERVGDHATNMAEMVYFAVTGREPEERERGDSPLDTD